jgi:hypothetical protein
MVVETIMNYDSNKIRNDISLAYLEALLTRNISDSRARKMSERIRIVS